VPILLRDNVGDDRASQSMHHGRLSGHIADRILLVHTKKYNRGIIMLTDQVQQELPLRHKNDL
jgi:hypothetical protein